ncbi:MAG TPA: site-2 protease family protein [Thermoanaerobaculia bacterium]|jgi:Zn-dependent protease
MSSIPASGQTDDIATTSAPRPKPPARRSFAKFLSGLVILGGLGALKLKGFLILALERVRLLFVNPFEGFSITQYAVAGGSIVVTVAAYARLYPIELVLSVVIMTFIHEVGHAVVIRAKKLRAGYMVFVPFIGGAVTLKDQPRSAYDDAIIGLAGPIAGVAASLVTLQIYKWTDDPMYLMAAFVGFTLNGINLIPLGMLDGGRISAAITKWMWVFGGGFLLYHVYQRPNWLGIAVLVLAVLQVYAAILREQDDKNYFEVTGAQRVAIAIAYFSLVLFVLHQYYRAQDRLAMLLKQ